MIDWMIRMEALLGGLISAAEDTAAMDPSLVVQKAKEALLELQKDRTTRQRSEEKELTVTASGHCECGALVRIRVRAVWRFVYGDPMFGDYVQAPIEAIIADDVLPRCAKCGSNSCYSNRLLLPKIDLKTQQPVEGLGVIVEVEGSF
jgi:hypothetical protein